MKNIDDKRTNVKHLNKRELSNKHQNDKIKDLKVVLRRYEVLPKNHAGTKSKLIEEILFREKVKLKLNKPDFATIDINTENENNISQEKIKKLVEQKKALLFPSQNDSDSDSVGSVPANVLEAIEKQRKQQLSQSTPFPVISKYKINKYFALLSSEKKFNEYERELNKCVAHLHTSIKSVWNSPSCIIKAINDSILQRKWHNLPQLLLMLLHLPPVKYMLLIRNICQIMAKLHPIIQDRGLQDQFNMIHQMYKRLSIGIQI